MNSNSGETVLSLHHVPIDILGSLSPGDGDEQYYELNLANGLISNNPNFVIDYCLGRIPGFEDDGVMLHAAFKEFTRQLLSKRMLDPSRLLSAWHSHRNIVCEDQEFKSLIGGDDDKHTSAKDKFKQVMETIPWEKMEIFASENPCLRLNHDKGHKPHYPSNKLLQKLSPTENSSQNGSNVQSPLRSPTRNFVNSDRSKDPHRHPFTPSYASTMHLNNQSIPSPNKQNVPIEQSSSSKPRLYGSSRPSPSKIVQETSSHFENVSLSTPLDILRHVATYHDGSRPVKWPGEIKSTWSASNGPPPFPYNVDGTLKTSFDIMSAVFESSPSRTQQSNRATEAVAPSRQSAAATESDHLVSANCDSAHADCLHTGVSPWRLTTKARVRDGRHIKIVDYTENFSKCNGYSP
eukprot:GDKJ01002613.1.p1 GENE.GDKJ01002613.1~~GDKJ01002613.1.p1  ORF type:complete len:420 (-),score=67.70 GDKJ01002613.1:371-1588(-)